jgi:hypothetical protein
LTISRTPDSMPMLSPGRHRNPAKGACFMEMASYLAGEKWSDHPTCTHPLLGELARHVNDLTGDDQRQQLAPLIPSVVGLAGDDLRVDATIALRCAQRALPVAPGDRHNVLAVSIITADHMLGVLTGRLDGTLEDASRAALETSPEATEWAHRFVRLAGVSPRGFRKHAAPNAVRVAMMAIRDTETADAGQVLVSLLTEVIADCEQLVSRSPQRELTVETPPRVRP